MSREEICLILWVFVNCLTWQVYTTDRLIVVYWGQDTAFRYSSRQTSEERDLVDLCVADSPFDIINIGFVDKYFDLLNSDRLPGTNFDRHCYTPVDNSHRGLYKCPVIERGIRTCQQSGKKIVIAIGGPDSQSSFESESQGERFAENIWDLFLGGDEEPDIRPFGSAICDGVNLLINRGSSTGYTSFARHLYYLARSDRTRRYIITASPTCDYPDQILGPGVNKPLEIAAKYFTHLYVRFYGSNCGRKNFPEFNQALEAWRGYARNMQRRYGLAPLIFIGVPAMDKASTISGCYRTTRQIEGLYGRLHNDQLFGGFMIWDASWDQLNVQDGKRYSERLLLAISQYEEEINQEPEPELETQQYPEEPTPPPPQPPLPPPSTPPPVFATTAPIIVYPNTRPPAYPPSFAPPPITAPAETSTWSIATTITTAVPYNTSPPAAVEDSDESPYPDINNEMQEGDQPPDETKPDEERPPNETGVDTEAEDEEPDEEDDRYEDPVQPRPPDMENRFPNNLHNHPGPEPVNDFENDEENFDNDHTGLVAHAAEIEADKAEKEAKINHLKNHLNDLKNDLNDHHTNLAQNNGLSNTNQNYGNQQSLPVPQMQQYPSNMGLAYPGNLGNLYPAMPVGFNMKKKYFPKGKSSSFPTRHSQPETLSGSASGSASGERVTD